MSIINQLACKLNRNDEEPNVELAGKLAESEDRDAIREIALHLSSKDKQVQSDCVKVLYEIGYLKPQLIEDYAENFLQLIAGKNNRLVWGAMTALAAIADRKADRLYESISVLYHVITNGSVITVDNGIKVLAKLAASKPGHRDRIFPFLLHHIATCRPKEVPQHAESILPAVDESVRIAYLNALKEREPELSAAQLARVKKIFKKLS